MFMKPEKRAYDRKGVRVFVDQFLAPDERVLGRATNLSNGGMYLLALPSSNLKQRRYLWVHFWLPGYVMKLRALAEVIRHTSLSKVEGTALRFKFMFPDHREILEDYLDRRYLH